MEECKVCGKEYKKITSSHVGTHSLTMDEYDDYESNDVVIDDVDEDTLVYDVEEVIEEEIENDITEEEIIEVLEETVEVTLDKEYWVLNPTFRYDSYCLKYRTESGDSSEMYIAKDSKFELPKIITTNIQMSIKRHIIIKVVE